MNIRNKLVLLVDDSPIIIERIKDMLNSLDTNISVLHAEDYSSAMQILDSTPPTIAILDINLPDKNGIILLQSIRKNYPDVIVIMMSNQAGDYYRNLCKSIGAQYFVDKSTEFERIPGIISSLG